MSKAFKKRAGKSRDSDSATDSDANSEDTKPKTKKAKTSKQDREQSGGSDPVYLLSDKRRVEVTNFKGNFYVDIREFYMSGEKRLPGKKGISLKIDEWHKLKTFVADIDAQIEKLGAK